MERGDRGGLRGAGALAQLALIEPVLFPQDTQEIPHAECDAVRPDARFERTLQGAMRPADLVTDALFRRIGDACLSRCTARLFPAFRHASYPEPIVSNQRF